MAKSQNDRRIAIPVELRTADGKLLPIPGLIAIPDDRLDCFEEIARIAREILPLYQMSVDLSGGERKRVHASDGLRQPMLKLGEQLKAMDELWDDPQEKPESSGAGLNELRSMGPGRRVPGPLRRGLWRSFCHARGTYPAIHQRERCPLAGPPITMKQSLQRVFF